MRNVTVGGQAVIEGVMMRGVQGIATAVRNPQGEIVVQKLDKKPLTQKYPLFGLPIVRGAVALIDSLKIGLSSLNWSASIFGEDEEPTRFERYLQDRFGKKGEKFIEGATLALSLSFSILLFFVLPTLLTGLFSEQGYSNIGMNMVEASIRISLFIGYIYLISKMKDIYRVFQYHGAEHKVIVCYEKGLPLTVENARVSTRFHERCGTNFMFLVMIVSILVFSFTGWSNPFLRVVLRILLLPLVAGITYEILRWLGKGGGGMKDVIAAPGMLLQRLTTKEPDDSMLEVSIRALMEAEGLMNPVESVAK